MQPEQPEAEATVIEQAEEIRAEQSIFNLKREQWRIHRGGAMGEIAPPPYGFKKIFFLNIFIVKY